MALRRMQIAGLHASKQAMKYGVKLVRDWKPSALTRWSKMSAPRQALLQRRKFTLTNAKKAAPGNHAAGLLHSN